MKRSVIVYGLQAHKHRIIGKVIWHWRRHWIGDRFGCVYRLPSSFPFGPIGVRPLRGYRVLHQEQNLGTDLCLCICRYHACLFRQYPSQREPYYSPSGQSSSRRHFLPAWHGHQEIHSKTPQIESFQRSQVIWRCIDL